MSDGRHDRPRATVAPPCQQRPQPQLELGSILAASLTQPTPHLPAKRGKHSAKSGQNYFLLKIVPLPGHLRPDFGPNYFWRKLYQLVMLARRYLEGIPLLGGRTKIPEKCLQNDPKGYNCHHLMQMNFQHIYQPQDCTTFTTPTSTKLRHSPLSDINYSMCK